ncbi:MAG TPA: cysteine synthase A [Woeseiaceae bacterium]|nr:cysteine synthase A [Woeseiaceae bacterium]
MKVLNSILDGIGNTALIRLNKLSAQTGCEILGKAEFMNPGGSVKDRAALGMMQAAVANSRLVPGGTIVEGTAGNTGIGLALVGAAMGFRSIIVMPDNQSRGKIDTLRAHGAEIRLVPPVPYKNPGHFVHTSMRIAAAMNEENPGSAFWPNQFENLDNRLFHEETTGAEIWLQTDGKVDGFVCSVGTGGTLGGVSRALKARNPDICIGLADPGGSALHNYYANGELKLEGTSISEGIGNSRVTANLAGSPIDISWQIPDSEAIPMLYRLIRDEGLVLGGSSGINVAGAVRLAEKLGPGHTVVTILCDSATRYTERLFNVKYLASKGLRLPEWIAQ